VSVTGSCTTRIKHKTSLENHSLLQTEPRGCARAKAKYRPRVPRKIRERRPEDKTLACPRTNPLKPTRNSFARRRRSREFMHRRVSGGVEPFRFRSGDPRASPRIAKSSSVNGNYRTRGSEKSFYEARPIPGDPARRYAYREVPRRVAGSEVALRVRSRMYPSRSRSLHGASRWRRDSPLSPTDIFISDEAACAHKKSTRRAIRSPINTSVTSATPALGSLRTRNPAGRRGRAANRCEVLIRVPSSPLPSRSAGECRPRLVHGHPKR